MLGEFDEALVALAADPGAGADASGDLAGVNARVVLELVRRADELHTDPASFDTARARYRVTDDRQNGRRTAQQTALGGITRGERQRRRRGRANRVRAAAVE
jgi:hypothetical protein